MFCVILVFASNANTLESEDGEQFPPYLFLSVENAKDIQVKQNPTIVRSRLVNVDFSLLPDLGKNFTAELGGEIRLILNAFQGTEFTVLIQKIIKKRSGSYAWYGILKDFPLSRVTLVLNKNTVFGSISKAGFFYQIRPVSDGIHVVYEIDPSKFPPTSEPITPNTGSRFPSNNLEEGVKNQMKTHISGGDSYLAGEDELFSPDPFTQPIASDSLDPGSSDSSPLETLSDDGSVIDLLVVYTAEARIVEGGTTAIEGLIDLAETATNAAYSNSEVAHVVRVVAKQEINFSEDNFSFSGFLSSAQNGTIPGLHDLRNTNGADLVVVLVAGDNSLCGLAYLMNPVSLSFAPFGYSVTQTSCAVGNFTFGHEIGHNMSARHDRANDNTDGQPFDYNHGYVDDNNNFKTIMGVGSNTRIQYFSNPNVLFGGVVTGVPEGNLLAADNRLTFQNTALTVSKFRDTVVNKTPAFNSIVSLPNSERVISPYWQSDSESYTFIAVTHTSLSGMASQVGVIVRAIKSDGTLFGSSKAFTIESSGTERVFIVRSGHSSINSTSIPEAKIISDSSLFQNGFVHINPVASNPSNIVEATNRTITMLSFWGAIVTETNTSGFAMEFIGDMQDSMATAILENNAPVVGPAAP